MITDLNQPWLKAFVYNIRQLYFVVQYPDEVMSDFLFLAHKDIDIYEDDFAGMSSKRFFGLARSIPAYDGATKKRIQYEYERQEKKRKAELARAREGILLPNNNYNFKLLAARAKKRLKDKKLEGQD